MKKKVLIIVVAGVLAGAGGAAALYLTRGGGEEAGAGAPAAEPPGLVEMEPFLVNIADGGGERYAKLTLRLTVSPAASAEAVGADEILQAKMRDRILTLLTAKTTEELVSPLGKEALRREIKATVGALLDKGDIDEVLFSDFVVQ